MDGREYKLSSQLVGHDDDVRGVCICSDSMIATGSRDRTVRLWQRDEQGHGFVHKAILRGHEGFVGPVAWIPPNAALPQGAVVSGGMDTQVMVWPLEKRSPIVLSGHTMQVSGLAVSDNGDLYSASIDRTIRRWTGARTMEVLKGHTDPVQAVLVLPGELIVTGSSDTTIRFWRNSKCVNTIKAHSDTVRALATMPGVGFVSASHDGTVKAWSMDGKQLMEMVGHTSLIFSVAAHSSGLVASGSEDATAKIWQGGACFQTIDHPGCVWGVHFLPSGDLVTACSDGVARVWTQDPQRYASSEVVEAYEASIVARKSGSKSIGSVKVSALPGVDSLQVPGVADGQTKVVREGDNAMAYSWNTYEYKWEKVGEVIDDPSASGNSSSRGDYVFDVDMGEGDMRKLPYNVGENPSEVAVNWLISENLPLSFKSQIVEFIKRQVGEYRPALPLDNRVYDPYTGGSAYVPGNPSNATGFQLKHTPRVEILVFNMAKYEGMLKKIAEFNDAQGDMRLTAQELEKLQAMTNTLKDTPHYASSQIADADLSLLTDKLLRWPLDNLFPVLDLLRMLVLHPNAALFFARQDVLLDVVKRAFSQPVLPSNVFLCGRLVVNCFKYDCFRGWLLKHRSEILDYFSDCKQSTNKNVRSSYGHLAANYALRLVEAKDEDGQAQVLSAAIEVAEHEEDADTKFLALQTVATLVHGGLVKRMAKELDIAAIVEATKKSSVPKLAEVGADLAFLLK